MASIPDFITHYHRPDRPAFLNLADLHGAELAGVLSDLQAGTDSGVSRRRFGPRYLSLRRATEERLRARFIERGGQPVRRSPHYFVLGESAWFRGLYRDAAEVRVAVADLPTDQVSITYPDSITSMGLLPAFGITVTPRAYHGNVYRLEELPVVVQHHGLLNAPEPATYDGHQLDDFEHYVEVQLWSDEALLAACNRPVAPRVHSK